MGQASSVISQATRVVGIGVVFTLVEVFILQFGCHLVFRSILSTLPVKLHVRVLGQTLNAHIDFIKRIQRSIIIKERESEEDCDVIVAFCPVSSRIGTDIDAAIENLPDHKPVILVVMHHTYNADSVVVESSRLVYRSNIQCTVDCLFHESKGLLENCEINNQAVVSVNRFASGIKKYTTLERSLLYFCTKIPRLFWFMQKFILW
ncbi:uncharacterized protein [Lepisosteus oculatus]|uniref:uncharacterized protein isoform X1 n=1 Tax=Lepisosteus oculatus TaxID=7918 RepID=UPI0035F50A7F